MNPASGPQPGPDQRLFQMFFGDEKLLQIQFFLLSGK